MDVQLAAMLNQRERERRLRQAAQARLLNEVMRGERNSHRTRGGGNSEWP